MKYDIAIIGGDPLDIPLPSGQEQTDYVPFCLRKSNGWRVSQ